jgi:hypothetical protein
MGWGHENHPVIHSPRARILDVLKPESGGPRKRRVLEALVGKDHFAQAIEALRAEGLVRMYWRHGGPHYKLTRKAIA